MNQFASRLSDQLQPRVVVDRDSRQEARAEGAVVAAARAAGGSGPGRRGRRSRRPSSPRPRRRSNRSSPARTVNPKPRGWCERGSGPAGWSAATALDDRRGAVDAGVVDDQDLVLDPGRVRAPSIGRRSVSAIEPASLWAGMTTESFIREAPATLATASSCSVRARPGCRRARRWPPLAGANRCARTGASSRRGRAERRPAGPRSAGSIATSLPVSSRQISVVSAQREADLAPAADVADEAVPAPGVGELLVDQLDQVVDVQQVAHLLARRRRSRCS